MVTITKRGPKISESDIAKLEELIGAALPEPYRRFLLEYNGGKPTPNTVDVEGLKGSPTDVKVLYGIDRPIAAHCIGWNLTTLAERLEDGLIPIAGDSLGSVFCLSVRKHDRGAVLFCDLQAVYADFEHDPEFYHMAPNFDVFLNQLYEFQE